MSKKNSGKTMEKTDPNKKNILPTPATKPAKKPGGVGNLKHFAKGQSGNPNGRPKKLPQLDVLMAEVLGEEQNGMTAAKAILSKLRQKAVAGDVRSAEILMDRAYGKAKQELNITERTIIVEHPDEDEE